MAIRAALIALCCMLAASCVTESEGGPYTTGGLLLSEIISPYTTNFHNTTIGHKSFRLPMYKLTEPFTGAGISVMWDTERLMREAQSHGITNITNMDVDTLRVFFGVVYRETLIVYGD